ncbi:hypothetical protein INT48_009013 [Thamnidium elegans]|uniref:DH domain-containing protein n=1 Tax=Thamnidium elegans TaxID=101142 RepID=A0A8H7SVT2_9FUNG|nr:hypothetical protein INT48_009013 [Thamnidium elegans]
MQQIDISLDSIGYIYSRQLLDFNAQPSNFNSESVCHFYDILVHEPSQSSEKSTKLFQQFNQLITSPSTLHHPTAPSISPKREFVKNDERRQYLLDEFIMTEANYLSSLKTFINLIVEPLRQRSKDRQRAIIGQYECANIFMNIDELATVTEDFYNDLIQYNLNPASCGVNLGDLCLSHMRRFTCYNRFLLGVHNAQIINEKQLKNPTYFAFLEKVINNQGNGNQTVYDYLALPSQRVGRYTMYYKELMKHTTDDHVDLPGLHSSLLKAEEIANMTEEIHTQIMKIFRRLLQAIQYCPESLISFQRRFLCYLDTTEIDPQTLKPVQPVTLFLFSDKIMVVKRPSYESDGLDLCGLDQRMYEGSERKDFCIRKEAVTGKMKFIGWANTSFSKSSFTLLCNNSGPLLSSPDTDQTTQKSLEAYFQHDQQRHAFALNDGGNLINREYFQTVEKTRSHFIHQFGKAKNNLKTSDELIQSSYCQWNHHHFFANIYPTSRYHKVSNKNEIALFYIEKNTVNIEAILSNCFIAPNMVGFVVPHEKDDNYRFAIRSKCAIGNTSNEEISLLTFRANDIYHIQNAQNQLFGNLLLCDRDLLQSSQLSNSPVHQPPQPSRFSIKQDLIRKKSKSTFKLFTSLANNNTHRQQPPLPNSPTPSGIVRPRTTSTYSEYILGLETSNNSIHYSTSSSSGSSIKSQLSADSRLTLQSLASNNNPTDVLLPQQSMLSKFAADASINQPRYFSPSFHPSRTASYEIQSAATKRSEEPQRPEYTNRSRSPLSIREPTPAMIEPGSGFSTVNSRYSSISTLGSQRSSLFLDRDRFDSPRPVSDLLIPIATPNSGENVMKYYSTSADSFTKRPMYFMEEKSDLYRELEEKNKTVLMLTSLLQKKEEEIELLKADLDDSVSELGTVCDKFNSELENLSTIYQLSPDERPSHPSPDMQMKRKLETALLERNQWQLRATELEQQLRRLVLNNNTKPYESPRRYHQRSLSQGMNRP